MEGVEGLGHGQGGVCGFRLIFFIHAVVNGRLRPVDGIDGRGMDKGCVSGSRADQRELPQNTQDRRSQRRSAKIRIPQAEIKLICHAAFPAAGTLVIFRAVM